VEIWRRVLGIQPIGVNDNFFELGGHSLQAVRMFAEVEKTFGKNIPVTTLFEAATVKQLADILRQGDWSPPESFVVAIQRNGPKPPFFGIHALGGDVLLYRDLARHLGPDQPFYGLRAQQLNGTKFGYASVEEMAQHYIKEIQKVQPNGPYFLGGVSFGGLAAFEMARQLEAQGQEVALLALFDAATPDYVGIEVDEFAGRFQYHWNNLKVRSSLGRLEYVLSKAGNAKRNLIKALRNSYRKTDHPSLPKHLIELEVRIRQAVEKYVPQVYSGKMTLFRAATQPVGTPSDPMLGWRGVAAGGLEIHEVPGDHRSIMYEPHVGVLAEKLKRCLDRALIQANQALEREQPALIDNMRIDLELCFLLSSIFVS
jgi:thioesterase domain-containing protein/acyl carrier protein